MNRIKQIISEADGVAIFAGAGMSVDSGIPDFRGKDGLWTAEKQNFLKFSAGKAWHVHPIDTWNFYISRFLAHRNSEPHRGYYQLKEALDELGIDSYVLTSNVDGFFEKAGYDSKKIYTIHGDLKYIQCSAKCCRDYRPLPQFSGLLNSVSEIPQCHWCGAIMRPMAMMFNDPWFVTTHIDKQALDCWSWMSTKTNIVGIEIGAGLAVSSLRVYGQERTATLIRINPHDYTITRPQDISIKATALEGIATLAQILAETE